MPSASAVHDCGPRDTAADFACTDDADRRHKWPYLKVRMTDGDNGLSLPRMSNGGEGTYSVEESHWSMAGAPDQAPKPPSIMCIAPVTQLAPAPPAKPPFPQRPPAARGA
jgi:hypothetical protein